MRRSKPFLLILLFLILSWGVGGSSSDQASSLDEISQINLKIKLQGLKWKAGPTSMTHLSLEEKRQSLGGLIPLSVEPDRYLVIEKKSGLPASLDWRDKDGRNYITTVKNQLSCGSCWAFSAAGVAEAIYNVEKGLFSTRPSAPKTESGRMGAEPEARHDLDRPASVSRMLALAVPDISEQDLVSCSSAGNCTGGWASLAFDYMKNKGVVSEKCFSYKAKDAPCQLCANWGRTLTRIKGWGYVTQDMADTMKIKTALQDGPLSFWMDIYDDFYNYESGIYEKTAGAEYVGGHLIVLVGYNDAENYWICKNSWGTAWGENGYFKIRRGQCGGGSWISKAWGVSIANTPPVLGDIPSPVIKEGQPLSFRMTASDPDGDALTFRAEPLPQGATCDASSGEFKWTPSYTQSGLYDITCSVSDGMSDSSRIARITVLNVKKGKGRF